MVAALRQLIEADIRKAMVSVKLQDQHRVVQEVVAPAFDEHTYPEAGVRES